MSGLVAALLIISEAALQGLADVPFLWVATKLSAAARWCRGARFDLSRPKKDQQHG